MRREITGWYLSYLNGVVRSSLHTVLTDRITTGRYGGYAVVRVEADKSTMKCRETDIFTGAQTTCLRSFLTISQVVSLSADDESNLDPNSRRGEFRVECPH